MRASLLLLIVVHCMLSVVLFGQGFATHDNPFLEPDDANGNWSKRCSGSERRRLPRFVSTWRIHPATLPFERCSACWSIKVG